MQNSVIKKVNELKDEISFLESKLPGLRLMFLSLSESENELFSCYQSEVSLNNKIQRNEIQPISDGIFGETNKIWPGRILQIKRMFASERLWQNAIQNKNKIMETIKQINLDISLKSRELSKITSSNSISD
jgi:hypothetical protein